MKIKNAVVLVTGANRGLGLALAKALVAGGARKVYAAARDASAIALPGVQPIQLDVTKPEAIAAAARAYGDVDVIINNAGISRDSGLFADTSVTALRDELETNVIGPFNLTRAFAPILARNGGGAVVNVLSVLSWVTAPHLATYSVTKSAAWSLTNGIRNELRGQGTQVLGVHVGYIDTDLARNIKAPKTAPDEVARSILAALEAGNDEVVVDEFSRQVRSGLSAERGVYLGQR
jgi:NAD(P)-dependent dehydrogenase (short-subunit alcohol dehydrogenase family)